jgi:hypothetical protein
MEKAMTDEKRTPAKQLDNFVDGYLRDLVEMPDDAVLEASSDARRESMSFRDILKAAIEETGKRRIKLARRALEQLPPADTTIIVDTAEARRYLAEAANDNRITLAARDLKELPDEEVHRLYLQLKQLEKSARDGNKD